YTPHERLPVVQAGWRLLARSGRDDVRDRGERAVVEVLVVLIERDEVRHLAGIVDVSTEGEKWRPHDLGGQVRLQCSERFFRVVVLDVELPRNARGVESVEDRR